jgi:hypothetical protein
MIMQNGGRIIETFPGPGNLEEIFFDKITKGEK